MPTPPIIIIKKKGGHGGHHGGAWKVAYADFVTAMMALFIVLWLTNTSKPIQVAISGYFKDPSGTGKQTGSSLDGSKESGSSLAVSKDTGNSLAGSGENFQLTKDNMGKLKAQLQRSIRSITDLDKLKKNIEMTVTQEGLRIELLESAGGTFFDSGSATLNQSGRVLITLLAVELQKVPNHVSVEGHTDAKPYSGKSSYSNWELSADRANAARRLMQQAGLRGDQVSQVRGFADQRLRTSKDPLDPSNRRVSIIVQYLSTNTDEAESPGKDAKEPAEGKPSAAGAKAEPETTGKKEEQ
ncbi:MAG TPA: flagellar motor protein MotB [Terriglobales bacterium]|jgi:chemotaxis protein MotB|nr:flagellar motor protein MotB [Terriglobales bacterium]